MTEDQIRDVIAQCVEDLFTNGFGEKADRLVLTVDGKPPRDLGGWGRGPVRDRMHSLLESLLAERPQPQEAQEERTDAVTSAAVQPMRDVLLSRRDLRPAVQAEQEARGETTQGVAEGTCETRIHDLTSKPLGSPTP